MTPTEGSAHNATLTFYLFFGLLCFSFYRSSFFLTTGTPSLLPSLPIYPLFFSLPSCLAQIAANRSVKGGWL